MTKTPKSRTAVVPLPSAEIRRLRAAVAADPDKKNPLGLATVTVARALAGYPVRAGTAALIRERLAAAETTS